MQQTPVRCNAVHKSSWGQLQYVSARHTTHSVCSVHNPALLIAARCDLRVAATSPCSRRKKCLVQHAAAMNAVTGARGPLVLEGREMVCVSFIMQAVGAKYDALSWGLHQPCDGGVRVCSITC